MLCEFSQDFTTQLGKGTVKVGLSHYRVKYRNKPGGMDPRARAACLMVF